jgi:tetratricopeptide (TPR) repeat protein
MRKSDYERGLALVSWLAMSLLSPPGHAEPSGCVTGDAATLLAQGESDSKGIQREPGSTSTDEAASQQQPVLQGNIKKDFPTPETDIESGSEHKPEEAGGRLQAIISTTGHSAFDRYMQQGYDAFVQGRLDESEKQYTLAIRELKKTGASDLRLAKARNATANTLLRAGNLLEAKQTFELALKTARQNPVPNLEEAKALAGLGAVARTGEDYKKAEALLKQAIDVRQKVSGESNIGVAQGLFELGELYKQQQLYSEAEPVYQLALETLNKAKEVPDLTKAYYLDKTGMLFHDQAKMPEAKRCFAISLELKDKYSTLYTPVDGRKRGLVYYRCENGYPNAARVFTRQAEVEYLHIKDAVAVATLTAQIFSRDWYLLKAEVTIQNQGKTSITACSEPPTLSVESPKRKSFSPLDSDAIASELGARGSSNGDVTFRIGCL